MAELVITSPLKMSVLCAPIPAIPLFFKNDLRVRLAGFSSFLIVF